jgi:hypothetical protein
MPATFSTTRAGLCLVCVVVVAGCQSPVNVAKTSQVQFEVTDRSDPEHVSTKTVPNGSQIDFPQDFNIEIKVTGSDPAGIRGLLTETTSYVVECNGLPIALPYRTKVLEFPRYVTAVPATPTQLGYKLPLSTLILTAGGWCEPPKPLTGSFHVRALVLDAKNAWYGSDLTVRIGNGPLPPGRRS